MRKTALIVGAMFVPLVYFAAPALAAHTHYSCTDSSAVKEIDLPAGIPTPGGNTATAIYLDLRPVGNIPFTPIQDPTGYLGGEGAWIYMETDGSTGIQRGGYSSLPTTPLTGQNDFEICNWGCDAFGGIDPDQGTGCTIHDELIF